jgi:hypothetical protein
MKPQNVYRKASIDPFINIIGKDFRQPKEGLGMTSPVAHMWRTMARRIGHGSDQALRGWGVHTLERMPMSFQPTAAL